MRGVCGEITERARSVDPAMPDIEPTHLLTMYYTTPRKLGWHRDNNSQDGASVQPVVSVSLGNACDFLLEDDDLPPGSPGKTMNLRLESGDVVLFGGPSRWIKHTVQTIHLNTCPANLLAVQFEAAARHCPIPWCPPSSFRLNLTFRHAPELRGLEETDKFHYFAASARKFQDEVGEVGVEEARRGVVERRRVKKERKGERGGRGGGR